MGDSDPLPASGPGRYRFVEHRRFLDGLLEAIGATERVTFVVHDWGSALGFDWANRHRGQVAAVAYMEGFFPPTHVGGVAGGGPAGRPGHSLGVRRVVLERNVFVQEVLPGLLLRRLSQEEMAEYRRPFLEPGERRRGL